MLELLFWLFLIETLAVLLFPLAFRIFSMLPDRGWALIKPLALLLFGYGVWLIGLSGILPNSRWSAFIVLLIFMLLAWVFGKGSWKELLTHCKKQAPMLIFGEAVFLAFFSVWAGIRASLPEIQHTEQPMDFMFLNAVIVSPYYPPNDPWLAGQAVSYYYFGYLIIGALTLLSGVTSSIAYNLAIATIAGLSGQAAFGLVANMVRLGKGNVLAANFAGLGTAFLLLVASNLAGALYIFQAVGITGEQFWHWVGISGFEFFGEGILGWFPTGKGGWWWPVSRVIPGAITEFPHFSMLIGDLHPHLMAVPFLLLVLGLAMQIFLIRSLASFSGIRTGMPVLVIGAFAVGALAAVNIWDFPIGFVIIAGSLMIRPSRNAQKEEIDKGKRIGWFAGLGVGFLALLFSVLVLGVGSFISALVFLSVGLISINGARIVGGRNILLHVAILVLGCLSLAIGFFAPFYSSFENSTSGIIPLTELHSRPLHLLLVWGSFILLIPIYVGLIYRKYLKFADCLSDRFAVSCALGFAPIVFWLQPVWSLLGVSLLAFSFIGLRIGNRRLHSYKGRWGFIRKVLWLETIIILSICFFDAFMGVGPEPGGKNVIAARLSIVAPLALILGFTIFGVWSLPRVDLLTIPVRARGLFQAETKVATALLGLLAIGISLVMGAELFHVADAFGASLRRLNTIFKFYYQAWIILSIITGYSIYYVSRQVLLNRFGKIGIFLWFPILFSLLLMVSYYPIASTASRIIDSNAAFTLDGEVFLASSYPSEYAAIQWIRENTDRDSVILESAVTSCVENPMGCSDWTPAGRFAGFTGRPTVLGWIGHERQWRSQGWDPEERLNDVREIYSTIETETAKSLLRKYHVEYVVVSPREESVYGTVGLKKFALLGEVLFPEADSGTSSVVIYRLSR